MYSEIIKYFESINPMQGALYATCFTWFVTALGAAFVFFIKKGNPNIFNALLFVMH